MTILWAEGFDNQNAAADILQGVLNGIVIPAGTFALVSGRYFSGKAVGLSATGLGVASYYFKNTPANSFAFTHNNILLPPSGAGQNYNVWWAFYDGTALAPQVTVALNANTGQISAYLGWAPYTGNGAAGGTLLAQSAAGLVAPNAWAALEIGLKIDPSAGYVQVNLNGAQSSVNLVGANTQATANATYTSVLYGVTLSAGTGTTPVEVRDDFYLGDSSGSSYTSFIGPGAIWTTFPTGNNAVQFTPLTGANWQEVSETAMDGDTSYNSNSSSTQADSFSCSSTLATGFTPQFLKIQNAARAASGTLTVTNSLLSGTTTTQGVANSLTGTYAYHDDIFLADPATLGSWTVAVIEATKWGYKTP